MPGEADPTDSRFVLLEHHWEGVHWDLMLERDGVLKTWALDALPCDEVERDARPLPDHRAAYLEYEGPISGDRGAVRRIDEGSYRTITWQDDLVVVRILGRQLVGVVRLTKRVLRESDGIGPPYWKISLGKFD